MVFIGGFRAAAHAGVEVLGTTSRRVVNNTASSTLAHKILSQAVQARAAIRQEASHTFSHVRGELRNVGSDIWNGTREALSDSVSAAAKEFGGGVMGEGAAHFADKVVSRAFRSVLNAATRSNSQALRSAAKSTEQMMETKIAKEVMKEVRSYIKDEVKDRVSEKVKEAIDEAGPKLSDMVATTDSDLEGANGGLSDEEVFEDGLNREDFPEENLSDASSNEPADSRPTLEVCSPFPSARRVRYLNREEPASFIDTSVSRKGLASIIDTSARGVLTRAGFAATPLRGKPSLVDMITASAISSSLILSMLESAEELKEKEDLDPEIVDEEETQDLEVTAPETTSSPVLQSAFAVAQMYREGSMQLPSIDTLA